MHHRCCYELTSTPWCSKEPSSESAMMVSTSLCSLRAPLEASRCMPDMKPAPRAKDPGQINRLLSPKDWWCFSRVSAVPWGGSLPRTLIINGTQKCKSAWELEPGHQGASSGWLPQSTRAPDVNSGAPNTYKSSPSIDVAAVGHGRGRA